jgi:hypothetical protein
MRIPIALILGVILIPALGLAGVAQAVAQPVLVSPVPLWGIVLGTIIVAGLLYLLVHGPDGVYYRYPYYGEYYRYYYRPEYRPYTAYYVASGPIILVAPTIVGDVLGVVVVGSLEYIVTRDAYGHLYRYPYYGPYRKHYYRAAYRPYVGPYVSAYWSAPVRQGDRHWDADTRDLAPAYQRPQRQSNPAYHQPQRQPNPNYQQHQPEWQSNPAYYPPQPHRQSNPSQNDGRGNSGGSHKLEQKCGHAQEQSCSNKATHQ